MASKGVLDPIYSADRANELVLRLFDYARQVAKLMIRNAWQSGHLPGTEPPKTREEEWFRLAQAQPMRLQLMYSEDRGLSIRAQREEQRFMELSEALLGV